MELTKEQIKNWKEEAEREAKAEAKRRRELLQKMIDAKRANIAELEWCKERAKSFAGKVLNVRFERAIREHDKLYADIKHSYDGLAIEVNSQSTGTTSCYERIAYARRIGGDDKRLDYEKFCSEIDTWIMYAEQDIVKLEADLKDGIKRMNEYNEKILELNELTKTFSNRFKELYKHNFKDFYGID